MTAPSMSKPNHKPFHPQTTNRAARPTREIFDAFNSSASGHQRAENRLSGSTSWRDSRSTKLAEQFASGLGGGRRIADTVGAGSKDFGKDGRTANGGWLPGTKGLRPNGQMSLRDSFGGGKQHRPRASASGTDEDRLRVVKTPSLQRGAKSLDDLEPGLDMLEKAVCSTDHGPESQELYEEALLGHDEDDDPPLPVLPGASETSDIFRNLTVYINGSTAPLISDHKVKRLLVDNGARISIALGRRSVTHVVLGHPNGSTTNGGLRGAGGGLASSKIQKEITKIRNCGGNSGVKFVSAEWVVESVRRGKRLPESRFECLRLAPNGVKSIESMFHRQSA